MKKVKLIIICVMLTVMCSLTGCVDQEIDMVINADGSSTFTVEQRIDKAAFSKKCKKIGMKSADIKDCYKSFEESGFKLKTIGTKEYYVQSKKGKSKKGELSKQFKEFDEEAFASVNAVYFTLDMKNIPEVAELIAEAEDCDVKLPHDAITMTINLEFPYSVVRTTGKIDADNPHRVSFTADIGKKITVFATTEDSISKKSFAKPGKVKIKTCKAKKKNKTAQKAYIMLKYSKADLATKYQIQYTTQQN